MSKQIDPRTTRKTVQYQSYIRNLAVYSQYQVLQTVRDRVSGRPSAVVVELKPEHCGRTRH